MKTIRLSKLLFNNYPKESQNLVDILNKHNISYEILKNYNEVKQMWNDELDDWKCYLNRQ